MVSISHVHRYELVQVCNILVSFVNECTSGPDVFILVDGLEMGLVLSIFMEVVELFWLKSWTECLKRSDKLFSISPLVLYDRSQFDDVEDAVSVACREKHFQNPFLFTKS